MWFCILCSKNSGWTNELAIANSKLIMNYSEMEKLCIVPIMCVFIGSFFKTPVDCIGKSIYALHKFETWTGSE